MSVEFNEKGKFFTEIVSKFAISAIIQTTMHRVEGDIHVRAEGRLIDELNAGERFLAVTNAKIYHQDGSLLYKTNFISISRSEIVWIIPNEDIVNGGQQ